MHKKQKAHSLQRAAEKNSARILPWKKQQEEDGYESC
ncbi:MAG: hypothetical protein CLLPBCKN_004581 [Chroococcidiopsis cubana SAG 39.79]|nr:hypothetical protein [Chroococcidiopsis cubana SAG 39.79]